MYYRVGYRLPFFYYPVSDSLTYIYIYIYIYNLLTNIIYHAHRWVIWIARGSEQSNLSVCNSSDGGCSSRIVLRGSWPWIHTRPWTVTTATTTINQLSASLSLMNTMPKYIYIYIYIYICTQCQTHTSRAEHHGCEPYSCMTRLLTVISPTDDSWPNLWCESFEIETRNWYYGRRGRRRQPVSTCSGAMPCHEWDLNESVDRDVTLHIEVFGIILDRIMCSVNIYHTMAWPAPSARMFSWLHAGVDVAHTNDLTVLI